MTDRRRGSTALRIPSVKRCACLAEPVIAVDGSRMTARAHDAQRNARSNASRQQQRRAPSPGEVSGMAESATPRRPPRGLPHAVPGAELHESAAGCVEGCPRADARSGCARSTGCHASPGAVWRSKPGANHLRAAVTPRDARAGTSQVNRHATTPGVTSRAARVRVRDEEVAQPLEGQVASGRRRLCILGRSWSRYRPINRV